MLDFDVIKMKDLRDELRKALIEYAQEDYLQSMKDPEILNNYKKNVLELTISTMDESELDDKRISEIYDKLDDICSNPDELKKMAYNHARNKYMSKDESIVQYAVSLEEKDSITIFGVDKVQAVKNAYKEYLDKCDIFYNFTENLITALLKSVEKNGFKKAIKNQLNSIIKQIVPTAEEYIEIYSISTKKINSLYQEVKNILEDEEDEKENDEHVESSGKIENQKQDPLIKILLDLLKRDLKMIYG